MEKSRIYLFTAEEKKELQNIVKDSFRSVRQRLHRMAGEYPDEYAMTIRDETLLEIADRLTNIALHRQREAISVLELPNDYRRKRRKRN